MILPVWLFVILVALAAYGLFMLSAPPRWRAAVLVVIEVVPAAFLEWLRRSLELTRMYREFNRVFFVDVKKPKKKKRSSRKPKGHGKPRKRRRR